MALLLLEGSLRLFGFGYPCQFLLRKSHQGAAALEQNNKFGWRFFGSRMSRLPAPISIPESKPPSTVRIFVFGESAAYGDPQPEFGLPQMLRAILSLRHPGTDFEVVNAAMTAINSHVILPISRDCARANGDVWVIYMGNNEVVGPFGSGSIFGARDLPLRLIRSAIAFKGTRTGQLMESVFEGLQKPPPGKSEWGGLAMFLSQALPADNPRLQGLYENFARNVRDIIRTGEGRGVGIVISTVAVNLKDCAPFGSGHKNGLTAQQKEEWARRYSAGTKEQSAGNLRDAATWFDQAAQIDDTVAELRFRKAACALALGDESEARRQFRAARDLDTLRFRCDSELNAITRRAASGREGQRVRLADAEQALAQASPGGTPGSEFFYDHVHLTFEGNYLLARTIATEAEKLLPNGLGDLANAKWPSAEECAARLGWSEWSRATAAADMFSRLQEAPFTAQANHLQQLAQLRSQAEKLGTSSERQLITQAREICEAAVAKRGADPYLYAQLATLEQKQGDLTAAARTARQVVELLPSHSEGWAKLGAIQAQQKQFNEAIASFERAYQLDSQDVFSRRNRARALAETGRKEEAIAEYRRTLALKPRFGPAWLGLGQVLEQSGRKAEAEQCYHQALTNRVHLALELAELARFCQMRGWLEAAMTNYDDALERQPSNPLLHVWAGQTLEKLRRRPEAAVHYATAAALAPEMPEARFLHGMGLGWEGRFSQAADEFKETLRLRPDLVEARLNLGIALRGEGRDAEALEQIEQALRQSPSNRVAIQLRQQLLKKLEAVPAR